MKITKIVNNNVVLVGNSQADEYVAMGKGVGFGKKTGDTVDETRIKKKFILDDQGERQQLTTLLKDIPTQEFEIVNHMVDFLNARLPHKLSNSIYLTLTDHMHLAIERLKNHEVLPNPLESQIQFFYPDEFKLAKEMVAAVAEHDELHLPPEEIGLITLHIVNSENSENNIQETMQMTNLVAQVLDIIAEFFGQEAYLPKDSPEYHRLVTHLQFFARRYLAKEELPDPTEDDQSFTTFIKEKYDVAYACAQRIDQFLTAKYQRGIGENEITYLTLHIEKIPKNRQL